MQCELINQCEQCYVCIYEYDEDTCEGCPANGVPGCQLHYAGCGEPLDTEE